MKEEVEREEREKKLKEAAERGRMVVVESVTELVLGTEAAIGPGPEAAIEDVALPLAEGVEVDGVGEGERERDSGKRDGMRHRGEKKTAASDDSSCR